MSASPSTPSSASRTRSFGQTRVALLIALLILLAVCFAFSWITRGAVANLAFLRSRQSLPAESLVDLRPWQTARTLASLAVTAEEKEYAREAEHLADHEVDQAFAAALRQAELDSRRRVLTGQALALSQRVAQLQREIAQDKSVVDQLKAKSGLSTALSQNPPGSDALEVAQAQLGLDSDELNDAQRDLDRTTGNLSIRIQQELAAHDASMQQYDRQQRTPGQVAVVSEKTHRTLVDRLRSWFDQRTRYGSIQQAQAEAQSDAAAITAEHSALDAKAEAPPKTTVSLTLAQIQNRSSERQILAIDDDRIQTDQQLAEVYGKWGGQVLVQHQIVLHLILVSLEWILGIILAMVLGDTLVRRLMARPSFDRRQIQTLRTILEVSVQVVGILLLALVLFGPPQQTATLIGLATAALTIALQDYIIAFLGWFVLAGRHGIRVGDLVQINGISGEVVELGLVSTTLLETTSLAEQGEPTGRRVSFLNGFAIRGQFFNFSSDSQWMWDEIAVSVPAGQDIYALAKRVEQLVHDETGESSRRAEQEWTRNLRAAALARLKAEPVVTLRPSGGAIEIRVRYITCARGRSEVRDRLFRKIISLLHEDKTAATLAESAATA
jgi:small-conductance mechanosensitive channel